MSNWFWRYQSALAIALGLHVFLAVLLMLDPSSHERPVMTVEKQNEIGEQTSEDKNLSKQPEIVKAEAIDNKAVMETVERLKQTRLQEQQQIAKQQQALLQQAQRAREERVAEQNRLQAMKKEEEKIAIAHKKAVEEEKLRLAKLVEKKEKELKALNELKSKQQALKLAQAKQKKLQAALDAKHQKELADKKSAQQAEQASIDAAKRARIAGEVDKYKARILNAISRQWILPENIRPGLSSQFRIRLAPDGAVLDVSLMRSSGDPILDRSAQTAIFKASPLPVPVDADTFAVFRDISLTVRPESLRG